MSNDDLFSVHDAATELGISAVTLRLWIAREELKTTQVSGVHIIRRRDLEAFRTWYAQQERPQRARRRARVN